MKSFILTGIFGMMFILVASSCAQGPMSTAPPATPATSPPQSGPSQGTASWEMQWEKTLAAARTEGEVLVYLNITPAVRKHMVEAFSGKYGIKMDAIIGSAVELVTRMNTEYRAGVYQVDVFVGGLGTVIPLAKPLGFLAPLEPMLILPEIKDPKAWINGKLPFFDQAGNGFVWLSVMTPSVLYNTDMVKEGEIRSYLDLLESKWKEKIVMADPSVPGSGQFNITTLVIADWGLDKTKDFFRSMVKQQMPVLTRDVRLQAEWVSRAKYPVALWPQTPGVSEFVKAGAPLGSPVLREAKGITPSNGGLAVPTRPPHPNAATVFVNWLLSREGQRVASRAYGAPSTRVDVPPEDVVDLFIPKPGQKIFLQSEESTMRAVEWAEEWRRILNE